MSRGNKIGPLLLNFTRFVVATTTHLRGPKMKLTITADRESKQLTITLTDLDWEAVQERDFYQGEQQIQRVVTAVGQELTRQLLASKVTSVPTLCQAGQVWYRKAASVGHYLTLYGPIAVRRPNYQTTAGRSEEQTPG